MPKAESRTRSIDAASQDASAGWGKRGLLTAANPSALPGLVVMLYPGEPPR
jgi:hypothetical protein